MCCSNLMLKTQQASVLYVLILKLCFITFPQRLSGDKQVCTCVSGVYQVCFRCDDTCEVKVRGKLLCYVNGEIENTTMNREPHVLFH